MTFPEQAVTPAHVVASADVPPQNPDTAKWLGDVLDETLPPPPASFCIVREVPDIIYVRCRQRGYSVTQLTPSAEPAEFAFTKAFRFGPRIIDFFKGMGEVVPIMPSMADALLLSYEMVLMRHPERRRSALAEARHVLRPGGVLITALSPWAHGVLGGALLGDYSKLGRPDDLCQELVEAEFQLVHLWPGADLEHVLQVGWFHRQSGPDLNVQVFGAMGEAHRRGMSLFHFAVAIRKP